MFIKVSMYFALTPNKVISSSLAILNNRSSFLYKGKPSNSKIVDPEDKERVSYLKGCQDTIIYLMTGRLPNDGNHDGMKNHKPRHGNLDALD